LLAGFRIISTWNASAASLASTMLEKENHSSKSIFATELGLVMPAAEYVLMVGNLFASRGVITGDSKILKSSYRPFGIGIEIITVSVLARALNLKGTLESTNLKPSDPLIGRT
jgi:hypothetical protein